MCFHISTYKEPEYWEKNFRVKISDPNLKPVFSKPNYHLNGFSHPNMLIIPQEKSDVLAPGVWGIVPSNKTKNEIKDYYKEAVKYGSGLNAQSEKVFQHFIYRDSIMTKRCVIPINGFYEPHEHNKKKYPFYITVKNEHPFALAGIYSVIDSIATFTILTKAASPLFAKVHNTKKRQVIMMDEEQSHNWLSNDLNTDDIKDLIQSDYPAPKLEAYSVRKDLFKRNVNSNVDTITDRVDYPELSVLYKDIAELTQAS
ncbi:SOS response-associated peptidase [Gelidibacter japonicus]|uniref:SOS response-associated peptidase n=1 Tax=Gelidibacter japonicus TaxID=1962232 RepID=UPI0013D7D01C|nr:SOS response-associated peptidase family protein [Gelidibacter japonicus]